MQLLARSRARVWRAAALAALFLSSACGSDQGTGPNRTPDDGETALQVTVVTFGVMVDRLTAEVTGPGIGVPLVFNLQLMGDYASGTLRLPPGDDRTITLKAFDETGEITHEGSTTIDVRPGMNPPVSITLRPRAGQVPIDGTIGSLFIQVDGQNVMAQGATAQFTATVYDVYGNVLNVPPADLSWAVANPAFASVDADGLVTGLAGGTTLVVASYDGVAGVHAVTVLPTGTARLRGNVYSLQVGPLPGVVVSFAPSFTLAVTDQNGEYVSPVLPAGSITAEVSNLPSGCEAPSPIQLEVTAGSEVQVNFLVPCGAVPPQAGMLVFTEIMADPEAQADAEGEWVEIYNASNSVLSVDGLSIANVGAGQTCQIFGAQGLLLPGQLVLVGLNFPDPDLDGLPNPMCSGVTLPNTGLSLQLSYFGQLIDEVSLGLATPGAAFSLSRYFEDASLNDDPGLWCLASTPFGAGDLGTPGTFNPSCQ